MKIKAFDQVYENVESIHFGLDYRVDICFKNDLESITIETDEIYSIEDGDTK